MQNTTKINVEVHCTDSTFSPAYRLYLNNTLLTERTFIWDNKVHCIDEEIVADIREGAHNVTIELVKPPGDFELKNIRINGVPVTGPQFII